MNAVPLEICIDCSEFDAASASICAALAGGATRVELCADMEHDGITPQKEFCLAARRLFGGQRGVQAMIRPHAEGFHYSPATVTQMVGEIDAAAAAGADGVVFGPLDAEGKVDTVALTRLCDAAHGAGLRATFHRAFDALADPVSAIPLLIKHRVDRVLTSGTPWGSRKGIAEGVDRVRRIIELAGGRIEVVCAGGIEPGNVGLLRPLLALPNVSVHAYSGVLRGGRVDALLVRALAESLAESR